jgi:nucleoside-diphosphate-sugar epimerase
VARALVTGATGLVGSHLVERLVADGWHVRALVRDPDAARWLADAGAELARGDVLDGDAFARAASGREAIFHAAAVITPRRNEYEEYRVPNVEGTRNAIEAAAASGARLVQVSSVAVYGPDARYGTTPTDESRDRVPLPEGAYYARSKRESETLVRSAHASGRIWGTAVRPDVIYGKRDRQFTPRVARLLRFGIFPLIGGGHTTIPIVHAANVADGAVRAVGTDAAGGQAYNLANDYDVTVAEFIALAARGLGRRVRTPPMPISVARAGVELMRLGIRLVRGNAVAQHAGGSFAFLTRDNPFTSERARRELGWSPPVRPGDGVPEAFRFWISSRIADMHR